MRAISKRLYPALVCVIMAGGGAQAMTLTDGFELADSQSFAADSIFDAVVQLDLGGASCSGTLIAPTAVLTARHCTDIVSGPGDITVNFRDKDPVSVTATRVATAIDDLAGTNPGTNPNNDLDTFSYFDGSDIAILTIPEVLDIDPFSLLDGDVGVELVTMVGYGRTGDLGGADSGTGIETRTLAQNVTFIDMIDELIFADFDDAENSVARGLEDGDDNLIAVDAVAVDEAGDVILDMGMPVDFLPVLLDADGNPIRDDAGDLVSTEGMIAPGDSGSALFVERNGQLLIAGVATGGFSMMDPPASEEGTIGVWTSTSTAEARAKIIGAGGTYVAPIPLPLSAVLLAGGLGLLPLLRRRS